MSTHSCIAAHSNTIVDFSSTGSMVVGHDFGNKFSVFVKGSMSIRVPFQGFGPDLWVAVSVEEASESAFVHTTYLFQSGQHTRRRVPGRSFQTGGS